VRVSLAEAEIMTRDDDYREHGAACEWRSSKARDPEVKALFAELARRWQMMARQAERTRIKWGFDQFQA
jgi:hypothetical protein